jgi:hypothetical protein
MTASARWTILLVFLALLACEENLENHAPEYNCLIGSWFNPRYNDSIVTYQRTEGLVENEYGFTFKEDKAFIERKNSGWCGTPPISYADFVGTWSRNDSILEINVTFWGGTADYTWKILSIDEAVLKINRLEEIYNHEEEF